MSQLATTTFDQQKADAFADELLQTLNHVATGYGLSVGNRTGLFDTMARLDAATSSEIAGAAGLNERYVREWLGAMVTARIVHYDPAGQTYQLPAEHAALLTRAAAPNNLALMFQWGAVMGSVEDKIVDRFKSGGGVEYCHYHRFHGVMAEDSGQTILAGLLDNIIPLVPEGWTRLESGIEVLDLGCGEGRALILLAETFPNSTFTGYELCEDAVEAARRLAAEKDLANIRFVCCDAARIRDAERYDLIFTFDAIHDQVYPHVVLANINRALRSDGVYLMQDIAASSNLQKNLDHPLGPFLYTISTMHCMAVSLAKGGAGLGTVWGEELALEMLADAGFDDVTVRRLPHDIQNNYYIARKGRQ